MTPLFLINKAFNVVGRFYAYFRRWYSYIRVKYQLKNNNEPIAIVETFDGVEEALPLCESKQPNQEIKVDRILTVAFDDIRFSDIEWVAPLFKKYKARATFNKVVYAYELGLELWNVRKLLKQGHEIGCHTILHEQYPYFDPLFNGQDPNCPDGSGQSPFPSNDDLRKDTGNGCNAFGKRLSDKVGYNFSENSSWNELTDEQCQAIRNRFSVYRDSELLATLDVLSHRFLGTIGQSKNSWDEGLGCYAQGIFTGCKTTENHEIWERIFLIQDCLFRGMEVGLNRVVTWSWPGSRSSHLTFCKEGVRYYDRAMTKPANNLSLFLSSLSGEKRSITDVLRHFGYNNTHDTIYPGRNDGFDMVEQRQQYIFNAYLSRKDALLFPTTRSIKGSQCRESEGLKQFISEEIAYSIDRKNNNGIFLSLEKLRHDLASGIIAGCLWDSTFEPSEKKYWGMILRYCTETGVAVIPKKEAYDIAFCQKRERGNLIYNHNFVNTLEKFLPKTEVPSNPDGWIGDCIAKMEDGHRILAIYGDVYNRNYGLPYDKMKYMVEAKGRGTIGYCFIRNNSKLAEKNTNMEDVITYNNSNDWSSYSFDILVHDNPIGDKFDRFEGRGDKIIGIEFLYQGEMTIRNLSLIKTD